MILDDQVHKNLYKIRGFMHPVDAMIFCSLLEAQANQNLTGGLVEIGVFYGRSLFLIGVSAKAAGDKALGIDLFDIRGQKAYVDSILRRHQINSNASLLSGNSAELSSKAIIDHVGKVRFFHIDGGHERHHLENDSKLALESIAEHGVIAFDDFFNPQYPDLTVAIINFLQKNQDVIVPFCISKAKLYVTSRKYNSVYLDIARSTKLWSNAYIEEFNFMSDIIIHINQSVGNRALYEQFSKRGLGNIARYMRLGDKRVNSRQ